MAMAHSRILNLMLPVIVQQALQASGMTVLPSTTSTSSSTAARGTLQQLVVASHEADAAPGLHPEATAVDPDYGTDVQLDAGRCNRNGVPMQPAGCQCDAAWTGSDCSQLALLPAPGRTLGTIYPGRNSSTCIIDHDDFTCTTSSWGGTVTQGEDGQYHLLVSEMLGGCGLGAWQHNSIIRHATSSEIDGLYQPREVVLGVFAHNAACMDARAAGGPACILLHVGSGTHSPSRPVQHDCHGGFSPSQLPGPFKAALRDGSHGIGGGWVSSGPPLVTPIMHRFDGKAEWTNATMTCAPDAAGSTACVWSNPSGWVDSDGTAWVNYVLRGEHNVTGRGGYGFGLAKAPHWSGPYSPVAATGQEPYWDAPVLASARTPQQNCEDSTLYRDRRGDFHMLFHYFGLADDHGDHGGHAHAQADGTRWQFSEGHAWNLTMEFKDSEPAARYGYRQRPHVVLSPEGELTQLITGVVWDSSRPYPAECTKCTGTRGPCDRAWTVMQPLRTATADAN